MINKRIIVLCVLSTFLALSCGKPNDPDSIYDSGGYSVISRFVTPGNSQDVVKSDTLLFLAQGEGGLLTVNIKDPESPTIVSVTTQSVRGYSRRIVRKGNVVYLAAGTFGITVVDITNAANPIVTVSNLNMKPAKDLLIAGDYLFVATSEQGVRIADLTNPQNPDIRAGILTNGYANGLAVNADQSLLFVACGEMGLSIYNIADFQEGYGTYPMVAWIDCPGYAESVSLCGNLPIAFLACRSAGVQVIDFSDLNNASIVGNYNTGGNAFDLTYSNSKLYVASQKAGFQILDATSPLNLKRIGWINTNFALGFDFDDNYIYLADDLDGLIVIEIPQ
jgi:hypothetical protein